MTIELGLSNLIESMAPSSTKVDYLLIVFLVCLTILFVISINFLMEWPLKGDAVAYFQALQVIQGQTIDGFIPNRLLSTFFGLNTIMIINLVARDFMISWLIMNLAFYFVLNVTFYLLVKKIFNSARVALLGGLFLATNYGILLGGMWNFIMDMGGWAFFALSAYFLYQYINSGKSRDLYLSAAAVGLGIPFKEYAAGGLILILGYLLYENRFALKATAKKILLPAVIAVGPTLIIHGYIYLAYGYNYFDWVAAQDGYVHLYQSRLAEYLKSFGSLVNFLAFPFLGGLYYFWRDVKTNSLVGRREKIFIVCSAISALPIFLWPAITQRTLAISVLPIILIAGLMFKAWEKRWYVFLIPLIPYIVANFLMDAYVLDYVNLPF